MRSINLIDRRRYIPNMGNMVGGEVVPVRLEHVLMSYDERRPVVRMADDIWAALRSLRLLQDIMVWHDDLARSFLEETE
jgi:hypothetical protein